MTCPKCEVCQSASHHWMVNPEVGVCEGQSDYICAHCPATGDECKICGGNGCYESGRECRHCKGEGVIPKPEAAEK